MRELAPCSACSRHVYTSDNTCPFCGASCDASTRPSTGRVSSGLSRAAMHAARAALVIGAASSVGCSEPLEAGVDGSVSDASIVADATDAPDASDAQVALDATALDAAALDAAMDAGPDIDAGEADAGADVDIPIYGGIFPDPRKRAIV